MSHQFNYHARFPSAIATITYGSPDYPATPSILAIPILNTTLHSSAATTLTTRHTMAPSNQSITPDTNTSPSTSSSNKDLPIELWMQISEHVRSEDYARPRSVAEYAASLALHGDDGIEAAKSLPHLERESWRRSRPLYTINRTVVPRRSS
jgi:hypothetical protein